MKNIVRGGYNVYGYGLGVIMLDTAFPRVKGDIGNARTFPYPVLYKTMEGWTSDRVVLNLTKEDVKPFIDAARELETAGVRAITTSCGFLSLFQDEIASSVNVPVFTSALLMAPWAYSLVHGRIGILTANSKTLSPSHLEAAGCNRAHCVVYGLEDEEVFTRFTAENWNFVDTSICEEELLRVSSRMLNENADIKAIVLECANMPPYSEAIRKETGLPVFDIVNLANFIVGAAANDL